MTAIPSDIEAGGYLRHPTYGSRCQIYALKKGGLSARFYFARPYHSWERGLDEHTNGLVRQHFPMATEFTEVRDARVLQVQALLNGRPRRVLGYRTPAEVFGEALEAVGLSSLAILGAAALAGPDPPAGQA